MSNAGIYLKYGNYSHAVGECGFVERKQVVLSAENIPLYVRCGWSIVDGKLIRDTQAEITAAIVAMRRAYSVDGRDIGFYFVGGGATAHVVRNSDTIAGIRIVEPPQFPTSAGAEYATYRSYSIGVEWEEYPGKAKGFLSSTQSVVYEGDGGPDWVCMVPMRGRKEAAVKTEYSVVTVQQAGTSRGFGGYVPQPAAPLWTSSPPLHGPSTRKGRTEFPGPSQERECTWSYTFFF